MPHPCPLPHRLNHHLRRGIFAAGLFLAALALPAESTAPRKSISGIYPKLAMFNQEGECGTGAVMPWAGKLWVITYAPHKPYGSSDRLYEISPDLVQTIRPESIGGTPANRMIHRESQQLFIGPYAIDAAGKVRVIPWQKMPGRLTGNARHLSDPAGKIYFATMEEGLYEVTVDTLQVTGLIKDGNPLEANLPVNPDHPATVASELPGYHGKGLYSGQGRIVYSNNGDKAIEARTDPTIASGALAEWRSPGQDWQLVRRNQFTDVTGPGGVFGNSHPETDPLWSIGWDAKSLILMLLDGGQWHEYRLPKASYSYDGAHGWNTEWPRIREIGEQDLLMTMHGTFWRFPRTFSLADTKGIAPRSTYLKIVGDFTRWQDWVVLGCDDAAKSEFLNKRSIKGSVAAPGNAQSNLWFIAPEQLDRLGPVYGHGAVWMKETVPANTPSAPFLFSGYPRRSVHISHGSSQPVVFRFEIDHGDSKWQPLTQVTVGPLGYSWMSFAENAPGSWIRVSLAQEAPQVVVNFDYNAPDERHTEASPQLAGLAPVGARNYSGGLVLARGTKEQGELSFAGSLVRDGVAQSSRLYRLNADLELRPTEDEAEMSMMQTQVAVPTGIVSADAASVLVVDDRKRRWRFPKNDAFAEPGALPLRVAREVTTERDLCNLQGTFYELPAENAGGFARIHPITTHNRRITDYCSWRGFLVLAGVHSSRSDDSEHIVRSADGQAALWLGAVDDLWQLGRPVGVGGPWKETEVKPGVASDPYLMNGYEKKRLTLEHRARSTVKFRLEVDILGDGTWCEYRQIDVGPGQVVEERFPAGFNPAWARLTASHDTVATATFYYD